MANKELNQAYKKEDAFTLLSIINGWIQHADNKASILIAFIALLMGLNTDIFKAIHIIILWENIGLCISLIIILLLYFIALGFVLLYETMVLVARNNVKKYKNIQGLSNDSLLFFGDIQKIGFKKFCDRTNNLSEEELINELNEQITINSYIANKKLQYFNKALISAFSLLALTIVLLVLINT